MRSNEDEILPPCPLCGGQRVYARLRAPGFDSLVYLRLCEEISADGNDNFFLVAWACTTCGYVELHANISGIESD